jgi:hypothetical protein
VRKRQQSRAPLSEAAVACTSFCVLHAPCIYQLQAKPEFSLKKKNVFGRYTFIPPNVLARMMEHKDKACRADDKKACRAEDKTARATSHKEVRSKSEELLKAMDATVTTVAVRDLPRSRSDGGGAGEEDACLACSHSHDMGILATEISRCTMMFCALDRRKSDFSGAHDPKSPRQGPPLSLSNSVAVSSLSLCQDLLRCVCVCQDVVWTRRAQEMP